MPSAAPQTPSPSPFTPTPPNRQPYTLRPATLADLPTLSDISVAAFRADLLFLHLYPRLALHPLDFRHSLLSRLRTRFHTPSFHFLVATAPSPPSPSAAVPAEEIIGFALYERILPSPGPLSLSTLPSTLYNNLNLLLLNLESLYASLLSLDRSVSPSAVKKYAELRAQSFTELDDYWHLRQLAVSPGWQRRGVGGVLVDWGMEQGRREGVPVGLESSPDGRGLYEGRGFRVLREVEVGGEGDGGWKGDPMMVWEPEGWGEEKKDVRGGEGEVVKG